MVAERADWWLVRSAMLLYRCRRPRINLSNLSSSIWHCAFVVNTNNDRRWVHYSDFNLCLRFVFLSFDSRSFIRAHKSSQRARLNGSSRRCDSARILWRRLAWCKRLKAWKLNNRDSRLGNWIIVWLLRNARIKKPSLDMMRLWEIFSQAPFTLSHLFFAQT